ncbi:MULTISPECIES: hypothetical protein [unclassified Lysobacter]|uniref:hypothetical protein n=1 Tax=unclassified Lysobacter TaxID=2635362 RepID=UPI001BE99F03|nr:MULTISPECIES: hypothetical protein [unclassified Lysobacter]MBT2745127.1 hypothetical protein [Lysobacter sp. ISL-42]MBT2750946.1 hypothetical protein [Lysobacter sp. ISL-50]MBT2778013.1 hypothetical protein [Lysobacter sp. ISL-54]MBT2783929.1 hypothetical protein [Lysobacter sp. ISL-52]
MPVLTNAQLRGLAAEELDAGTEIDQDWPDPYPESPCWGFALFGGPGGFAANTPPTIFEQAVTLNDGGIMTGMNPGFVAWVHDTFDDAGADAQAQVFADNFQEAFIDLDDAAQEACTGALARLSMILAGLTLSDQNGTAPTRYAIVMASEHWYTWEHWALSIADNVGQPDYPQVQYAQRDAGVNPVNTRCGLVWGDHPILTTVYITELQDGHIEYLRHAAGWPG